jgi:hypothetical protein
MFDVKTNLDDWRAPIETCLHNPSTFRRVHLNLCCAMMNYTENYQNLLLKCLDSNQTKLAT